MQRARANDNCNMKEEDTDAQVLFWSKLNEVMASCGHPNADLKSFMADDAVANWRATQCPHFLRPNNVIQLSQLHLCCISMK